jgi:DNA polymerase III alpha subunit
MSQAKDENTEKGLFVLLHDDCMKYSKGYREFMEKYPEVHEHVATLFKQNRSIGRHAGGVLIAPPELLERTMPLISVRGDLQTPWSEGVNFRHLEDNGFLKFDFLGLALIRDVQNCIGRILKKRLGRDPNFLEIKEFFDQNLNCRYVKADDQKVWEYIYHQRRKVGIFQFTESGARKFCEDSKPRNITELAAITSIFRPGPLKAGVHNQWVEVVSGKKSPQYDHPIIKEVLEETHGFIVFQEDFMLLSQKVAGFSPGESDKMRKTLVKKSHDATAGKVSERDELRKKFIDGAVKKSGFTVDLATKLIDMIEYFAAYGFNRAHAVAYAFDSYYAAWLHTHYEKEWLMTILQKESSSPDGLAKTINEIKAYGYEFAQADINHSGDEWDYSEEIGAFVPPLGAVKGVGGGAMNEIIFNRPYKNLNSILFDIAGDWKPSKINKTALVALCKIEAFGSLEEFRSGKIKNHRQLLQLFTEGNNYETLKKGKWGLTKTALKKKIAGGETPRSILDSLLEGFEDMPDWSRGEKIAHFIELTSASPAALVFPDHVMDIIRRKDIPSALELAPGQKAIAWFCVTSAEEKKTKKGSGFVKLDILDHNSKTGVIRVWGKLNADNVEPYTLWIAEVKKDDWGLSAQSWHLKMIDTPD